MRYSLRDVPRLLLTPTGRLHLHHAAWYHAGPLLHGPAGGYRRVFLGSTRVVAVVGSFGKTTTARALIAALEGRAPGQMPPNSGGWVARSMFGIRPGRRYAVIEVGIGGPGEMAGYARTVRPDIAVVTSIGSEHNRALKTLEATRDEKAHMVRLLPRSGCAILNGDDGNVRWMRDQTPARVVTVGFDEGNDVRARDLVLEWPQGSRFTLHTAMGERTVRTRLMGRPMIYPVLAAVAVALNEGFPLDDVLGALELLEPTPGRLQAVSLPNGAVVLRDDFKGHLETTEAALEVLAQVPARRRIVILGEVEEPPGGQTSIYRNLGEKVARTADVAIFLAGSKMLRAYRSGTRRGDMAEEAVVGVQRSHHAAIDVLRRIKLGPRDVVLIKGRSTQRLARIALALQGRDVRCGLASCDLRLTGCEECPMLGSDGC